MLFYKVLSSAAVSGRALTDLLKSMDDRKFVGAVLLDFSAAFDVMDHELLLGKLKCDAALFWMVSYLSRRRQKVLFSGSFEQ